MSKQKNKTINEKYKKKDSKESEKGILSLDFIFSFLAVYAISMTFALLSVTLMMSEVVQYMTFSMARSHISGDISIDDQQDAVEERLNELLGTYLGVLIRREGADETFFKIETDGTANESSDDPGWGDDGGSRQRAYGVAVKFTSNVIKDTTIPLLGNPSDGGNEDFGTANIYAYLYREPSTEECLNFNRARWTVLRQRFPGLGSMPNVSGGEEGIEGDNGC